MVDSALLWAAAWAATLRSSLRAMVRDERGQGLMEYGILLGTIAVIAGFAFYAGGTSVFDFTTMRDAIKGCITFKGTGCK